MKKRWKLGWYLLVLCASCLLIGKCLRIFSGDSRGREDQQEILPPQDSQSDVGQQDAPESVLGEEQRAAVADFDAQDRSIVLDAGHGGVDPGKVGVNGANEKEINLKIAERLKQYLEAVGFAVTLTRTTDDGLYSETDSNKKSADLKARVRIMEEIQPDFAVSIHQNSFTQASSVGAQVFYFANSAEGKRLAEQLQETIRQQIGDGNRRLAKANTSYYLLKKSPCPMVIVECGFLSNAGEAELLVTEEYQDKMAWAICLGIVEYCRQGQTN